MKTVENRLSREESLNKFGSKRGQPAAVNQGQIKQRNGEAKGFNQRSKEAQISIYRMKEDGLDISLIKWSMPLSEECGANYLQSATNSEHQRLTCTMSQIK